MKNKVIEFMAKVEELKKMAVELAENEELWDELPDSAEEIECMAEHCDCCVSILKDSLK